MGSEIKPDTLLGGKIRLLERIGRGGMGDVWVARNEATHAELAVKTLHPTERTEVHDERFRREARLAATISHRHVVRVFDLIDEPNGTLGLVMELLRGGTVEQCLAERGPLPAVQAVAVVVAVLSALDHVHAKGIIHRDIKPGNVFIAVDPDGHVIPKVLDFGIAKLPAAGSALTVDGNVLGTPHYMSPEQIRGQEKLDGRSDMFSVAVVLYEMLTGERVFKRDLAAASLAAVLEHEVDPDPRIDPRLWIALSRALAKRPYERYGTCAEFAGALKRAIERSDEELATSLQELEPPSPPPPPVLPTSPSEIAVASTVVPRRANHARTVIAAGGAAILAVLVTIAFTRPQSATANAAPPVPIAPPAASSVSMPVPIAPPAASSVSMPVAPPAASSVSMPVAPPAASSVSMPAPVAASEASAPSARRALPRPVPPKRTGKSPVATTPGF